jgi:hypothetical protein
MVEFKEPCPPPKDVYRGWAVSWDYGRYTATSPDYEASWEGEEDGWVDNGQRVEARTREDLIEEVDAWFAENEAPASVDTRRMAETETGSGPQGPGSAVPLAADAQSLPGTHP